MYIILDNWLLCPFSSSSLEIHLFSHWTKQAHILLTILSNVRSLFLHNFPNMRVTQYPVSQTIWFRETEVFYFHIWFASKTKDSLLNGSWIQSQDPSFMVSNKVSNKSNKLHSNMTREFGSIELDQKIRSEENWEICCPHGLFIVLHNSKLLLN